MNNNLPNNQEKDDLVNAENERPLIESFLKELQEEGSLLGIKSEDISSMGDLLNRLKEEVDSLQQELKKQDL